MSPPALKSFRRLFDHTFLSVMYSLAAKKHAYLVGVTMGIVFDEPTAPNGWPTWNYSAGYDQYAAHAHELYSSTLEKVTKKENIVIGISVCNWLGTPIRIAHCAQCDRAKQSPGCSDSKTGQHVFSKSPDCQYFTIEGFIDDDLNLADGYSPDIELGPGSCTVFENKGVTNTVTIRQSKYHCNCNKQRLWELCDCRFDDDTYDFSSQIKTNRYVALHLGANGWSPFYLADDMVEVEAFRLKDYDHYIADFSTPKSPPLFSFPFLPVRFWGQFSCTIGAPFLSLSGYVGPDINRCMQAVGGGPGYLANCVQKYMSFRQADGASPSQCACCRHVSNQKPISIGSWPGWLMYQLY